MPWHSVGCEVQQGLERTFDDASTCSRCRRMDASWFASRGEQKPGGEVARVRGLRCECEARNFASTYEGAHGDNCCDEEGAGHCIGGERGWLCPEQKRQERARVVKMSEGRGAQHRRESAGQPRQTVAKCFSPTAFTSRAAFRARERRGSTTTLAVQPGQSERRRGRGTSRVTRRLPSSRKRVKRGGQGVQAEQRRSGRPQDTTSRSGYRPTLSF